MARLSCDLALAVAIALVLLGGTAWADADRYGDPEMGRSMDEGGLTVESEDPDDAEQASGNPDDITVKTDDPDEMTGESGSPDTPTAATEEPDEVMGHSTDLGTLPTDEAAEKETRPAPQLVPEVPPPDPDASASVRAAWREVESAERNLDAINAVYGKMREANYPRGERRVRIIAERNDMIEAVNRARTHYSELRGN